MFVGVVPVLLLLVFFALCGLLLLVNVGSYLVYSRLRDLQTEAYLQSRTNDGIRQSRRDSLARRWRSFQQPKLGLAV
jgi:hypothetical protein